jgi:hypothetical protein
MAIARIHNQQNSSNSVNTILTEHSDERSRSLTSSSQTDGQRAERNEQTTLIQNHNRLMFP